MIDVLYVFLLNYYFLSIIPTHTSQFRAIQYRDSSGVLDGPHEYTYDTIIDSLVYYLIDFHGYMGEFKGYTFRFDGLGEDYGI